MAQMISPPTEGPFITLDFSSLKLTMAQFEQLCRDNRDLRLELTSTGELIVMPPAGSENGMRNARIARQLGDWAEIDGSGVYFDSSTGFTLRNGAVRAPDASWLRRERWEALTEDERKGFALVSPDFVIELRSQYDVLLQLQEKMREYMANGVQMAWLIDPLRRRVHIYRTDRDVEIFDNPKRISGESLLPGFELNVRELW